MRTLCASALAVAFAAAAQVPQPPFRSGANYVRVDVNATSDGKPVEDLTAADFQVLEDGKPQTIDAFEHISAFTTRRPGDVPSADRGQAGVSPGLVRDRSHRRTFIVFLDTAHVSSAGSGTVAEPLIHLLDTLVQEQDAIAVMTPDITVSMLQLGPKSDVLVRALRENPIWGRRDDLTRLDETERRYIACYPVLRIEAARGRQMSELAQKLIERRRERRALEALSDVVTYLGGVDETRKTVIAVTEGWVLFGSDQQMLEPRRADPDDPKTEPPPGPPGITVGRGGKVTTDDPSNLRSLRAPCEADRLSLANVDDHQYLRDLIGHANRWNTSFYTIDPRGLAVFDASIRWDPPANEAVPLRRDTANLGASHSSMRTLAAETDGFAVLDSNDLNAGMQRIAQDLSSYYLFGYYSTNAKPDGKFREITVRLTRPGVRVRARKGYRAPTAEEVAAAAAPPNSVPDPRAYIAAALAELETQLSRSSQPALGPVRLFRRGPLTGNRLVPAAAMTFSRTDHITLERRLEGPSAAPVRARILDRNGQPIPIALATGERTDDTGRRWITTEVVLAPLGAGDYVIELDAGGEKTLTAVRVTR